MLNSCLFTTELAAEPGYILYLPKSSSYRVSDIKSCSCAAINFSVPEDVRFAPFRFPAGNQMIFV